MRKELTSALIGVAILAASGCAPTPTPSYRKAEDMRERWTWLGADPAEIDGAIAAMTSAKGARRVPAQWDTLVQYGPGHWVYEWSKLGDIYFERAQAAEKARDRRGARDAFLRAATYFQIAKYPYVKDADYPHYQEAYRKSMAAYENAGRYFDVPLEVVQVPFRGNVVRAYLHLPAAAKKGKVPLVVGSGGIDVFKTERYPLMRKVNEHGIAFLVLDLPGVGESNFMHSVPDHEQVYIAAAAAVTNHPAIDSGRVAVFASSWGGNAAARLVFTAPERFKGVVSACGPVHQSLNAPTWVARVWPSLIASRVSPVQLDVVIDRLGMSHPESRGEWVALTERLHAYSLVNQGLIGKDAKRGSLPLLIINDANDPVAPMSDMKLLADADANAEIKTVGEKGHCGSMEQISAYSADWLAQKLSAGKDTKR